MHNDGAGERVVLKVATATAGRDSGRRRHRGLIAAALVVALVFAGCATTTGTGAGGGPNGCPSNLPEFIIRTGDSVSLTANRAHLRQAWEILSAELHASSLLDICKNDIEASLGVSPPGGAVNGSVVKVRPVVPSPFDPENSIAAQVVYVTETANGVKAYAMTLMAMRASAVISGQSPDQAVYTHGTAGINSTCDQALDATYSAKFIEALRSTEAVAVPDLAAEFLAEGKVVQAPYYIGIGPNWAGNSNPYLSRDTTGRTVIDAVRAVSAVGASLTWGVVGHSQGGHAALAAAKLAPTYGAGTDLVGAIGMAPALNPEASFDYWLDAVTGEAGGIDPRPADGAVAPDSPSVMTLGAHLLWGLSTDVAGFPDLGTMLNRFYLYNSQESIRLNNLSLNPVGPSLMNSGDPLGWNAFYNMYTSGPSAMPSASVPLITPNKNQMINEFNDLDWKHSAWSIPREDRVVVGCGWATNGAPGGVLYNYAGGYNNGPLNYPAGIWQPGLPMMFTGAYTDPDSPVWNGIRSVLEDQSVIDAPIEGPLLITTGGLDSLFPTGPSGTTEPHTTRANVAAMCAAGSDVELLNDPDAGHGGAASETVAETSSWLLDRFDGDPVNSAAVCTNL